MMQFKPVLLKISLVINLLFVLFFPARWYYHNKVLYTDHRAIEAYRWDTFLKRPIDTLAVVFLGTSITSNFQVHRAFNNSNVNNLGVNGVKTDFILERFKQVLKHRPKKIFIEGGINDIAGGISVDTVVARLAIMINLAKKTSTPIYIQSILPTRVDSLNKFIPLYNTHIEQLCRDNSVTYINQYPSFLDNNMLDRDLTFDGIHLTAAGYYLWRKRVETFVNED